MLLTFAYKFGGGRIFSSIAQTPKSRIAGSRSNTVELPNGYTRSGEGSSFSTPLPIPVIVFFYYTQPRGSERRLIEVLTCISIMTSDAEHLCCAYWPFVYLLEKCLLKPFAHF